MNLPVSLALHFGLLLAATAAWRATGRAVRLRPLLLGLVLVAIYWLASFFGNRAQALSPWTSQLNWNWLGKVFTIIAALAFWRLATNLTTVEIGLTFRQNKGSRVPAAAMIALICAIGWADQAMTGHANLSSERLLFQAIMPGLDEELVFRGLLLALFVRAFGTSRNVLGAPFGMAEVMVTLLFAVGHGLFITNRGGLVVDWHALVVTGVLGAGFAWLRGRTGSLLAPVIAHNLSNFGDSFF